MKQQSRARTSFLTLRLAFAMLVLSGASALAQRPTGAWLWQIGKPDNDDREFALAPNRYGELRQDALFVIGESDVKRDWPFVQPGPGDPWAGMKPHTFSIVFGLKAPLPAGECKLTLDLVDTHRGQPPELGIRINGRQFKHQTPPGGGDESIHGQPAKGREHKFELAFPSSLLKAGGNEIAITTRTGCWILYDWVGLATPAGAELGKVTGTIVNSLDSPPALVERNGQLMQVINVAIRHFDEPVEAVAKVDGAPDTKLSLGAGARNFEVVVPAVQKESPTRVSVEVAGQTLAAQAITLKPVRKWVVYLLPHSHVDIGYTHVQTDVEKAQWKYLEMAMDAAKKSANNPPGSRFKWNVEVLWAVDSYLQQATREQRQQFYDAVRAGQVGLDALYGNMLTGLCRPEELLRLLRMGPELEKRTGVPVESAMITDVPGYTWGAVPAFAHTGVKYWSIGPNGGDRIGHTIAARGDKPFWWLGPNGKDKVLVWMTGTGYYRVFSSADNLLNYLGQLDAKGYPYDFVQVRHCLGDNGAPDVNFADTVKKWNDTHAYPKLVIATTAEMFRDFEKRYGDKIPTAQGDFTPYWEDGAASSALETALNRAAAERLVQAETLFALFNSPAYPLRDFYQAWRNVVLYDEHTWGAHNSISQPDAPFVKSQWAIKRQFAVDADQQSRKLLAEADAARGKAVGRDAPVAPQRQAQGSPPDPSETAPAIDVINTRGHGWAWELVVVPKELSRAGDGIAGRPENEATVVSQRLTSGELVFRLCTGGLRVFRFQITPNARDDSKFSAARAEGATLQTPRSAVAKALTLRLDEKTGGIASLIYDRRELVDTNAPTALNDYFYLPGSDLKGLQRNGPVKISVKEKGPLIASLLVESDAPGCNKLTREYRLHALRNYIEVINTVDKKAVRAKEGVHFGFGFNVPGGTVRMDVPWGVVRPEADQIAGACKNWFTVQRWVDISNDKFGVTWMTPDAPLVEVGGITANLIGSLPDPRAWKNKIEPSTTIYSWAMNNHWHTNYRAEQDGPTVFRYFIWPHGRGFDAAQAAREAVELSQPLVVLPARGDEPKAPRLSVSNRDVQVSAFKPSDDGKALIVRLFGASGQDQKTELKWADPQPKSVSLSGNSERAGQPISGAIDVPAWTIVTVRAELP
ncbi:MAG: hypothetical protein HZA90_12735 [Verrucomicrobia bacterium]|nr:hypothetical protein [Verrucomicrobiota bacterium]